MAKKKSPRADHSPKLKPRATPASGPFVSHREQNMRAQHFSYDFEMFDASDHNDLIALETILVLNRGARIDEDFEYRTNVFVGNEDNAHLYLQWLAMLFVDIDSGGRHYFRLHACQPTPSFSERECLGRIRGIRTGYENNSGSTNSDQRARWERSGKLVHDWQMPISMVTFCLSDPSKSSSRDLRLFVPNQPESIYNTMALQMFRQTIGAS